MNDTKTDHSISKLKNLKIVAITVIIFFAVYGLANFVTSVDTIYKTVKGWVFPVKYNLSDNELLFRSRFLSKELLKFSEYRRLNEPPIDFKKFNQYTKESSKYTLETETIYLTDYYPRLVILFEEYKNRKIKPEEQLYFNLEKPTNYIGLEEIAKTLVKLSSKLESKDDNP